jgi:hypothetical protein
MKQWSQEDTPLLSPPSQDTPTPLDRSPRRARHA